MSGVQVDPWARVRAGFVAEAERLVAELEASADPERRRLLPKAKRALRELRDPSQVRKRVPASGEVLAHRAQEIRKAVQGLDVDTDRDTTRRSGS
ncbi:hypothetical protein SMCF_1927 [Streptomyces coelicoflavus ZG0656]|nr:hypothetical protein SMCF_1927 [Streptomyces coelicoflavus ZG0656]MZE44951.1 hypothetical protein [Streptomyces sp. SID5477]